MRRALSHHPSWCFFLCLVVCFGLICVPPKPGTVLPCARVASCGLFVVVLRCVVVPISLFFRAMSSWTVDGVGVCMDPVGPGIAGCFHLSLVSLFCEECGSGRGVEEIDTPPPPTWMGGGNLAVSFLSLSIRRGVCGLCLDPSRSDVDAPNPPWMGSFYLSLSKDPSISSDGVHPSIPLFYFLTFLLSFFRWDPLHPSPSQQPTTRKKESK